MYAYVGPAQGSRDLHRAILPSEIRHREVSVRPPDLDPDPGAARHLVGGDRRRDVAAATAADGAGAGAAAWPLES